MAAVAARRFSGPAGRRITAAESGRWCVRGVRRDGVPRAPRRARAEGHRTATGTAGGLGWTVAQDT